MKRHRTQDSFALLCIAMSCFSIAGAHPQDSPLTFIPHRSDSGETVFINIPKKCFVDGRLICLNYHPLFPKRQAAPGSSSPHQDATITVTD